ncbi:uncharacterized protein LOC129594416 [Paramacrobiotus metropolitanus]|uniref:uncharacterized protein LOC129594416 n=1 Tax=Paramacrobiotus metropolitanus TaxID=2943436 RepID=UPI002445B494|nr:uncharacterized protein LOC129594416 [Paramacrobiotus metropolitanus]XP_055347074.1 uncharacterized protein LOC129594416 [Paramacrobiotus metropolitanus]
MDTFLDKLLGAKCGEASPVALLAAQMESVDEVLRNHCDDAAHTEQTITGSTVQLESNPAAAEEHGETLKGTPIQALQKLKEPILDTHTTTLSQESPAIPYTAVESPEIDVEEPEKALSAVLSEFCFIPPSFLLDPSFLRNPMLPTVTHFPESPCQLSSERAASQSSTSDAHHDDCTPTSGVDCLIEVQNPTWEAAVVGNLLTALHRIHEQKTTQTMPETSVIEQFSRSFTMGLPVAGKPILSKLHMANCADAFSKAADLISANKPVEAIPLLEIVTKSQPNNCEAWMLLALASYFSQNDSKAISVCKRYLAHQDDPSESSKNMVLLLLATCLSNEGDLAAMHSVLFQWMVDYFALSDAMVQGFLQSDENSADGCDVERDVAGLLTDICQEFLPQMPADGTLRWALAILEFSQGRYAAAGQHFEHIIRQSPTSPSVLNQISACLHNLRQFDTALEVQDQVLIMSPDFPRAVYNKALTLTAKDELMTALKLIQGALVFQQTRKVEPPDQFWYLAARIAPKLPAMKPALHSLRVRLMSAILARDLNLYGKLLDDLMDHSSS